MSQYDRNAYPRFGTTVGRADAGVIDQGLRSYMLSVYNYMALGLAFTGLAALGAYMMAVTTDPAASAGTLRDGVMLTSFGYALFVSPLKWAIIFAPLAMVFFLSARMNSMSLGDAQISFWVFAGLMGLSLSSLFLVYAHESIARVFFITAAAFGALSLYGYTTKRDLSAFGSFLIMGLFGIIIAALVNLFIGSSALQFIISCVGVLVFSGLTAWDTQRIKEMYDYNDDGTLTGRKAIMGALSLYLNFINLFTMLLSLFGNRE
jgi:FtsH-binding integral membrane protein